jgi:uncharacterized protein (DUF885 family)
MGCQPKQENSKENLNTIYTNTAISLFKARPSAATMYGVEESIAGGKYDHRLDDYSPVAEKQFRHAMSLLNQQIEALDDSSDNNRVMHNLTRYFAGNKDFHIGYIDPWMGLSAFIVNQINGPLLDIPNAVMANQSIESLADAHAYLKRIDDIDKLVAGVIVKMNADAESGWIAPMVIVKKSITSMQSFINPAPEQHPLALAFIEKITALQDIGENEKEAMIHRTIQLVKTQVYPAYQEVIKQLENQAQSAPLEAGIWAQENGAAFYQDAVKILGDTSLSPEQIHQLGLAEVKRINAEMNSILIALGSTQGTVGQRMKTINADPKFLYADSDAGREKLLADLNGYINAVSALMDEQFASRPKYKVEVRRMLASQEQASTGGMYMPPAMDGSTPGIYWINLYNMKAIPKFSLKTLTYHEAIPGHHWQIALNLEQKDLPMLRRIAPYNTYMEGWALYAEQLAEEMGLYKNDPYGNLGRLMDEQVRAVRLVVDTGLHYKKWTREQAIQYMQEMTSKPESYVVAEIERYMVWPGQALGYKLGMINILKLRDQAKQQLDDKFDIKVFHDLILLGGAVPMEILDERVANWIAGVK